MANRPSKQGVSTGILIVLLVGVLVSQALQVGAAPANKPVAAGDATIVETAPQPDTTDMGTDAHNIMTASIKTSGPTDLIMDVSIECSIITDVVAPGGTPTTSGNAEGRIRVWVVVDDSYIVPISDESSPPQPGNHGVGTDIDKTTFCNRQHTVTVTENEDGDDTDRHEHFLRTKTANAFQWVALNMGSGTHTIDVRAGFQAPGTTAPNSSSGLVGNRIITIMPEKFANTTFI